MMRLAILLSVIIAGLLQACSEQNASSDAPVDQQPSALANTLARQPSVEQSIEKMGGQTMGTQWSLRWRSAAPDNEATAADELELALQGELVRINALMSTWDPASELSLFNQYRGADPVTLHADTLAVIDAALPVSYLTAGRYDITLAPVIDLWGFNQDAPTTSPEQRAIEQALSVSGSQLLVRKDNTLRKRKPQVSVDVSSLAKGYAVDKLGEIVESFGIEHYLIDIGGELRARGERATSQPWRVGIESPQGQVEQLIALSNTHIASSGSYRNFRIEDGRRLSHIIDGESGRPIEHDLVSVTVLHENTMLADAWATALLVIGTSDAIELIQKQRLVAQLTVFRDGHFERIASDSFKALIISK